MDHEFRFGKFLVFFLEDVTPLANTYFIKKKLRNSNLSHRQSFISKHKVCLRNFRVNKNRKMTKINLNVVWKHKHKERNLVKQRTQ